MLQQLQFQPMLYNNPKWSYYVIIFYKWYKITESMKSIRIIWHKSIQQSHTFTLLVSNSQLHLMKILQAHIVQNLHSLIWPFNIPPHPHHTRLLSNILEILKFLEIMLEAPIFFFVRNNVYKSHHFYSVLFFVGDLMKAHHWVRPFATLHNVFFFYTYYFPFVHTYDLSSLHQLEFVDVFFYICLLMFVKIVLKYSSRRV